MLSTPHLLVGAAIVGTIKQPEIALPLAFLSHFALDMIPHWDGGGPRPPYKTKMFVKVIVDYLFGLSLVYFLTRDSDRQALILFGAFLGTAPDFIEGGLTLILRERIITPYQRIHRRIQGRLPFMSGLVTNIIVGLIGAMLVLPLR